LAHISTSTLSMIIGYQRKNKSMFNYKTYPFKKPPELNGVIEKTYDVTIVGGGPVGLTLALSLAKQGIEVVLLDDSNQVSEGSRAICFAKKTLEIFDKLGVAKPMIEKGVQWNVGRIFYKEKEIDRFDLSPEKLSKYPAFINLQQYYVEHFLIEAVLKEPKIDVRWLNKVKSIENIENNSTPNPQSTILKIETPEGNYLIQTKYLVACDGSRSTIRNLMNLEMQGERFEERFLIADFKMEADFPSERWFWFDPPFAPGQSILLHKQPDNLWRLDFKLGKNADSSIAQDKAFICEKIKSVIKDRPFELDWTSIYSFSSKKLERFVHENVIFIGDAAHVVSPFGARGANSGIQDADNLGWKLAKVLKGADARLLETFNIERTDAAAQNIACTGETNTFIAPQGEAATAYRNEILEKVLIDKSYKNHINCGRLSVPNVYGKYPASEEGNWNTEDLEAGRAVKDCFLDDGNTFLIDKLSYYFSVLCLEGCLSIADKNKLEPENIQILEIKNKNNKTIIDLYDLEIGSVYLITPDQYVLGRWKNFTIDKATKLINLYLSGVIYESATLQKSEQELIDAQVTKKIKMLSSTT
jgi:3-(3-hydroxy-phenyl)propionate hydroxylase